MTAYAWPTLNGLYGWWRAVESAAMVTAAGLTARLCRDRWAMI